MSKIGAWERVTYETIDSTNLEAKRRALAGFESDAVIIAETQTNGRGRLERSWESPRGAGLWMTQLFRARGRSPEGAVFLSALAMARALRDMTGGDFLIKWPNDIVINGKKACGMLAECGFDGADAWIALGSGLNLRAGALKGELPHATSVEAETGLFLERDALLEAYLARFDSLRDIWAKEGLNPIIEAVKPLSATLGRDVRIGGERARAVDIEDNGALVIDIAGETRRVFAGDVSVRGIAGYV